jgi:hypothetical protein
MAVLALSVMAMMVPAATGLVSSASAAPTRPPSPVALFLVHELTVLVDELKASPFGQTAAGQALIADIEYYTTELEPTGGGSGSGSSGGSGGSGSGSSSGSGSGAGTG